MKERPPNVANCVCGGRARIHKGEVGFYVRCERDPGFASATEYCTAKRAANAWNKAQLEMEQLTRDAVCAYHRRKSYGQYIAGIPVELPPLPAVKEDQGIKCVCCGLVIPAGSKSKRYCSPSCAERYRDRMRPKPVTAEECGEDGAVLYYDEDRPKCKECFKPIPIGSKRRKYCSNTCADQAMARQQRDSARRARAGRDYL